MATLECRLLNASIACYAIKNGQLDIKNPNLQALGVAPGSKPTVFVDGVNQINAGFVAETHDDWVVLALRGTLPPFTGDFWAWVDDWMQDFKAGPTDWIINGNKFGQVETGFSDAILSIWPAASAALKAINMTGKKGVLVTGHSKGAAMTSLAASLIKSAQPGLLVEVCCYAAPLTCDRTFQANYDALGLRPFTVRYQNEFDIVPFLPWWPTFAMLAAAERRARRGENITLTAGMQASWFRNDYVPMGVLRYLGPGCTVEYGQQAENDALAAIKQALWDGDFGKIAAAHHASGRYQTCICGVA